MWRATELVAFLVSRRNRTPNIGPRPRIGPLTGIQTPTSGPTVPFNSSLARGFPSSRDTLARASRAWIDVAGTWKNRASTSAVALSPAPTRTPRPKPRPSWLVVETVSLQSSGQTEADSVTRARPMATEANGATPLAPTG